MLSGYVLFGYFDTTQDNDESFSISDVETDINMQKTEITMNEQEELSDTETRTSERDITVYRNFDENISVQIYSSETYINQTQIDSRDNKTIQYGNMKYIYPTNTSFETDENITSNIDADTLEEFTIEEKTDKNVVLALESDKLKPVIPYDYQSNIDTPQDIKTVEYTVKVDRDTYKIQTIHIEATSENKTETYDMTAKYMYDNILNVQSLSQSNSEISYTTYQENPETIITSKVTDNTVNYSITNNQVQLEESVIDVQENVNILRYNDSIVDILVTDDNITTVIQPR